jgi:hypothetical protein
VVRAAWSVRLATAAAALAAALWAGCSDNGGTAPTVATRVRSGPAGDDAGPGARLAGPIATWTLPPGSGGAGGVAPAVPLAPGATGGTGAAAGRAAGGPSGVVGDAGGAAGVIPVPTPRAAAAVPSGGPPLTDPAIEELVAAVDPARIATAEASLQGLGASAPRPGATGEPGSDRDPSTWLGERFASVGDGAVAQVGVDTEDVALDRGGRRTTGRSVLATLAGISLRKRVVYAVAPHGGRLDGEASRGAATRPAEWAAVAEIARLLARRQWDATIRLAAFAGDETGPRGSREHASAARELGLPIEAALVLDEATGTDAPPGFAAGQTRDDGSRQLARYVSEIGERYGLAHRAAGASASRAAVDDATAFAEARFPAAVVGVQAAATSDPGGGAGVRAATDAAGTRLLLATVASLALAPARPEAPTLARIDEEPEAVKVSWRAVDDPSVAGYWVGVRSLEEPDYRPLVWAGAETDLRVPAATPGERLLVAVAAADDLGHLSLFSPEATLEP